MTNNSELPVTKLRQKFDPISVAVQWVSQFIDFNSSVAGIV